MKKWKVIKIISIVLISICVFFTLFGPIRVLLSTDIHFPTDFWGVTVHTKADYAIMTLGLTVYVFGLPLLAGMVLFIVSVFKLRKYKKIEADGNEVV